MSATPPAVAITCKAYAKVNLCLSVGAPEPADGPSAGWHRIASWMQCIDLHDDIIIRPATGDDVGRVTVRWADDAPRPTAIDWPMEKDLARRALRKILAFTASMPPFSVEVVKRIPIGGGLGGGSADAAAVLLNVPRLTGKEIPHPVIRVLASDIGSDVAFFLDESLMAAPRSDAPPRPALVSNFGEVIERVPPAASHLVLVIPAFGCPTPAVYKAFDEVLRERRAADAADRARQPNPGREKDAGPKLDLVRARHARAVSTGRIDGDRLFNDLAIPAFRAEPRLGRLATNLARAVRETPCLTGSGSCLFFPTTVGKVESLHARIEKALAAMPDTEAAGGAVALRTRLI